MKKIKRVLVLLIVFAVVGLIGGRFALGVMWRSSLEKYGSALTEVSVKAKRVWVSPWAGKITIEALQIGNPSGFKSDYALIAERVEARLQWQSLFSSKTVVEELLVLGAVVGYEHKLLESNLGVISNTVKSKIESNDQVMSRLKRRFQVDHVLIDEGQVNLTATLLGGRGLGMGLPRIALQDLGQSENGITIAELVSEILKAILEQAVGLDSSGEPIP